MAKQTRVQKKLKSKHRAVKPRAPRPLDAAHADNPPARHAAKKERAVEEGR